MGCVIEISADRSEIKLDTGGNFENEQDWIPTPPGMPEWAKDGKVFWFEIPDFIENSEQLKNYYWMIMGFKRDLKVEIIKRLSDEELRCWLLDDERPWNFI